MASSIGLAGKSEAELAKIAFKETRKLIRDTLRENEIYGGIQIVTYPAQMGTPQVEGIITLNTWYNKPTHTYYIEYNLNPQAEVLYDVHRFKETFEEKIREYFRKETYMYCNIIHPEEKVADQVDSAFLQYPTPYTIGYWKSLMGRYEFIEDRQQVYADARIFTKDTTEAENFENFCHDVYQIYEDYRHDSLTNTQKDAYLTAINNLANRYSRDSQQYKDGVNNLNRQYSINTDINDKVPEMFERYKTLYHTYFGKTLNNKILTHSRVIYLQIHERVPLTEIIPEGAPDEEDIPSINEDDIIDEENMQY